MSFAQHFCRQHGIPPGDYESAVLRESLYPAARRLRFLLALIPGYFEPDLIFIRHVGRLRRVEDFHYEEIDFNQDRANRAFLRRSLCLRASAHRLNHLVQTTLEAVEADADAPLGSFDQAPGARFI